MAGNINIGSINNGPVGRKNLIINGDFQVNQRGVSSGHTASGANEYTLDRWKILTSGQSITWSGTYSKTVTAPAGGFTQIIEGLSIRSGTYVISWSGTATCTVDAVSKSSGDTFTLTEGTNCTVTFSGGTVANVQVEQGDTPSQFEARSYGEELALCQRYYFDSFPGDAYPYGFNGNPVAVALQVAIGLAPFPVTMRAAPTITFKSNSPEQSSIGSAASTAQNIGTTCFGRLIRTSGSWTNTCTPVTGQFTADAEL